MTAKLAVKQMTMFVVTFRTVQIKQVTQLEILQMQSRRSTYDGEIGGEADDDVCDNVQNSTHQTSHAARDLTDAVTKVNT